MIAANDGQPPADDLFIDRRDDPGEVPQRHHSVDVVEHGPQTQTTPTGGTDSERLLPTIGVLLSGGLDSCVLVGRLSVLGYPVQPFYVRCGLTWEPAELAAVERFLGALRAMVATVRDEAAALPCRGEQGRAERIGGDKGLAGAAPRAEIGPLVVFDQPVADLYGGHWSRTGVGVPDALSADEDVFLPGRNALLLVKPALWCAQRGITRIASAVLKGNPFADATDEFFSVFGRALALACGTPLRFLRPCAHLEKAALIRLGRSLPLELSFSCIAPIDGRHCGRCNKCAERRHAFAAAGVADRTDYACGC